MSKINHPSVLSVIRAHNVSAFPFYALAPTEIELLSVDLNKATPVLITRETVRATQSAAKTPEAKRGLSNIQQLDFARLPAETGALLIAGNVLVTKGTSLEICNEEPFSAAHKSFVENFANAGGYYQLAERYVMNLLNGSILFRNRIGFNVRAAVECENVRVEVPESGLKSGLRLSLSDIQDSDIRAKAEAVVSIYADALSGKRGPVKLEVRAYAEFGVEQEVYPSQEFVQNQADGQGRVLAQAARQDKLPQAAFHGRKVGNALRSIDTWYPGAFKALPVEPYGVDQNAQAHLRKTKSDFYALVVKLPEFTEQLARGVIGDEALFVAAVFARGGVFSKKSEKAESEE